MDAIKPDDWIICVRTREGRELRKRHPGALVLSTSPDALRGLTLRGRAYITALADQSAAAPRLRENVGYCAIATGADPYVYPYEAP